MRELLARLLSIFLSPSAASRRQRQALASVILVLVILLVVLGSFFLTAGVSPGTSLLFWGSCLLLLWWAVFLAYLDVKSIRHEFRIQRKDLLVSIFSKPDAKSKRQERGETGRCSPEQHPEQKPPDPDARE